MWIVGRNSEFGPHGQSPQLSLSGHFVSHVWVIWYGGSFFTIDEKCGLMQNCAINHPVKYLISKFVTILIS